MSDFKPFKNPLFLTAERDIRTICDGFLTPLGISYFNYLRFYNDGSCYFLTTHGKVIEHIFENDVPIAAPIEEKYIKKNFNYFLLPIGSYDKYLHDMKINFHLAHFIDLIDRHDDYIELFCFGSSANNPEIMNFYLSNIDFLQKFKWYFKEKASDLIKNGETNKIEIPEIMFPPYQGLKHSSYLNDTPLVNQIYPHIKLTPRQYDCLAQISMGRTAKEAAKIIGLSHRTVENYIAHLKTIFDCNTKSQLIDIYLENFK